MKIQIVYLDMDGVIANFDKRFKEKFGKRPQETRNDKDFGGYFKKFIDDAEFINLELMPDALELLNYLETIEVPVEILSSTAREDRHQEIAKQKDVWLDKHEIHYVRNFVPGKSLKYKFAEPSSIIIDDTQSVIDDWKKAGGVAIHHKDALSTISTLKMLL